MMTARRGMAWCTAALIACGGTGRADETAEGDGPVALFPVAVDGKWGHMDAEGTVVIEPRFEYAWDFSEGLACVQVGLFRGYIDRTGAMVIEPTFGWAAAFSSGLAAVNNMAEPWGTDGEELTFYGRKKGWTFIDRKGEVIRRMAWFSCPPDFSEGKLSWNKDCRGTDGQSVKHDADRLNAFSEGLAAAAKQGKWGYLNHAMEWAIEPHWPEAGDFSDGLAAVAVARKSDEPAPARGRRKGPPALDWGYIDQAGRTVVEPRFEAAQPFSDGLAPVRVDGKWGVADRTGAMAVEPQHEHIWPFSHGLARVLKDGKQGFLDREGKLAIEPVYDAAWEFSQGLARVMVDGKEGYINVKGEVVWKPSK